jgi:hypothetical protein
LHDNSAKQQAKETVAGSMPKIVGPKERNAGVAVTLILQPAAPKHTHSNKQA